LLKCSTRLSSIDKELCAAFVTQRPQWTYTRYGALQLKKPPHVGACE
jgi:hypothetical protein